MTADAIYDREERAEPIDTGLTCADISLDFDEVERHYIETFP